MEHHGDGPGWRAAEGKLYVCCACRPRYRESQPTSSSRALPQEVGRAPSGHGTPFHSTPSRTALTALTALLVAALGAVAALTLVPTGTGWSWGSPVDELRWYATGLGSGTTLVQLVGNLSLLVVPAALAVLLWPSAGRPARLAGLALAAGTTIEVVQWALPLGRVVSPLDAVLNAIGATAAGLATVSVHRYVVPRDLVGTAGR
jgi:hypothetical protein